MNATMKMLAGSLLASVLYLHGAFAGAAVNILACEPEWASLAKEIGGDRVAVTAATTALQDPHRKIGRAHV